MTPNKEQIAAAYNDLFDAGLPAEHWREKHINIIRYCLTALSDDGWKLCPLEPTTEMKIKGDHASFWCADKYHAMLAAAPAYAPTEKRGG